MTHTGPSPVTTDLYPKLAAALTAELARMGDRMAADLDSPIGCEFCEGLAFHYALENWGDYHGYQYLPDTTKLTSAQYAEVQQWAAAMLIDGESIHCAHRDSAQNGMTNPQVTDEFRAWDTLVLVGIARRVTPERELESWVATGSPGVWMVSGEDSEFYDKRLHGEVLDRIYGLDLREMVIEQLYEYGVDNAQVNQMKS